MFCHMVEHEIVQSNPSTKKKYENLSKEEREALTVLTSNNQIITKPADKGGTIVIQDLRDYKNEANSQPKDRSV